MKKKTGANEVIVEMTVQITRVVRADGGMDKLKAAADADVKKFLAKLDCDDAHVTKEKRFYHMDVDSQ